MHLEGLGTDVIEPSHLALVSHNTRGMDLVGMIRVGNLEGFVQDIGLYEGKGGFWRNQSALLTNSVNSRIQCSNARYIFR